MVLLTPFLKRYVLVNFNQIHIFCAAILCWTRFCILESFFWSNNKFISLRHLKVEIESLGTVLKNEKSVLIIIAIKEWLLFSGKNDYKGEITIWSMLRNAQRSERGWDEFFSFSFCVTLLIGWREQPISLKKML